MCIVISAELSQCVPDSEVTPDAQHAPVPPAAALLQGCSDVEVRRHEGVVVDIRTEPTSGEARRTRRESKSHFLSAAHALMQLAARRGRMEAEAAWDDEGMASQQDL